MTIAENNHSLESELGQLIEKAKERNLSVGEILTILSDKAPALVLILLSLPFCQPIQIPGFSTPFGIAIAFLGLRMVWGKDLWLPKRLLSKEISHNTIQQISEKSLHIIDKINPWIHARLNWVCHSLPMQILNGFTIFLLGICLALPLPVPLTNLLAAWAIFFMSIGIVKDDGVFVIVGYIITLITFLFFLVIFLSVNHYLASL